MSTTEKHRYVMMTVDPVHVGTGGTRLGRVDLSIVREPGTNLPKIPGTSLNGALRHYAAVRYGKRRCAGQGQSSPNDPGHCGEDACPICYTFGYAKGEGASTAHSGVVSISDARLLLFPVYSMVGPVWVTCPSALTDFAIPDQTVQNDQAKWAGLTQQPYLSLGWLMVEKDGDDWQIPEGLTTIVADPVKARIVLLSDKLFSQVVNANLEVRTSVSINPDTGAAEDKALFTYEAIPRAAYLWLDLIVDDYRAGFPKVSKAWDCSRDDAGADLGTPWNGPADVIAAGLQWMEHLGVGGMGTRGFGRLRKVAEV